MTFDKALRLTSILLASAAFIGLSLGAHLPEGLLLVTGSALIVVLLRALGIQPDHRIVRRVTLSTAVWNVLVILAFAGFWIDLLWISGELLPAGVHFLLLLMVIKLFNLDSRRDYLHLYAISFMAILAAAASTTELWYVPVFLAYLITGVWTLVLYQLTRDQTLLGEVPQPAPVGEHPTVHSPRITPQLFWLANGLALGTILLTIVIFFAIPRVSAGIGHSGMGESIRTSGFSETVDLGMIGPIKHDPGVVMRVQLSERPTGATDHLYLRGMAYDRYDGRSWATQLAGRRALPEISPGTFAIRSKAPRHGTPAQNTIHQTIMLEALDTTVLFAASFPETVRGHFSGLQSDQAGVLHLPLPATSRIEYTVVSRPSAVLNADLQPHPTTYSQAFAHYYLQLPEASERVTALAQDITQGHLSAYDKAQAIHDHLSRHYRYSLDIPASNQERPIEEFLFVRKTGYCEHYATAMVIMLRSVGVPARLVTGFLATEWNEYGNYYLVRQRDAHAWVEVYLPQSGWITMDPTPAVSDPPVDPGWQTMGRMIDTLKLRWNRFFVQYSGADQVAVVRGLKESTNTMRDQAWSSLTSLWHALGDTLGHTTAAIRERNPRLILEFLALVLAGGGLVIGLLRYWPWRTHTLSSNKLPADRTHLATVYDGALRQAARHGLIKSPAATPLEFLQLVRHRWTQAEHAMATITELYCQSRYGQQPMTPADLDRADQCLRQLRQCTPPAL